MSTLEALSPSMDETDASILADPNHSVSLLDVLAILERADIIQTNGVIDDQTRWYAERTAETLGLSITDLDTEEHRRTIRNDQATVLADVLRGKHAPDAATEADPLATHLQGKTILAIQDHIRTSLR